MKKILAVVVFAVVCMVSSSVFAQEVPAAQTEPTPVAQTEPVPVAQPEPAAQTNPAPTDLSEEDAVPAEQNVSADELMTGTKKLVCDANSVCVWAPVKAVLNVPDEMNVRGEVDANVSGELEARVSGTIDVGGGRLEIERADRSWCERHPIGCAFIIIGVAGAVGGGAAYGAKCAGWFDTTNTVSSR